MQDSFQFHFLRLDQITLFGPNYQVFRCHFWKRLRVYRSTVSLYEVDRHQMSRLLTLGVIISYTAWRQDALEPVTHPHLIWKSLKRPIWYTSTCRKCKTCFGNTSASFLYHLELSRKSKHSKLKSIQYVLDIRLCQFCFNS